jgi:hypothetical protein
MAKEYDDGGRECLRPDTANAAGLDESLDLLIGAESIATFMFNDPEKTRQVYHVWESHDLPAFKVGKALWARRRSIVKWIEAREADQRSPPSLSGP